MGSVEILEIRGPATVQDSGRRGYLKYGVPRGGFMDVVSARIANYLVGNDDNAPLIEFAIHGPLLRFRENVLFSIGGWCEVRLNGVLLGPWRSYVAHAGDILDIGFVKNGVYGYIAFGGGIECVPLLGSCSTSVRAKFGDYLKSGDVLGLNSLSREPEKRVLPEDLAPKYMNNVVRVILGPDLENFTEDGVDTFLKSEFIVTQHSDRMGYRLEGPTIEHSDRGADIITDALPPGSVEVPGDGKPIIMMVDGPTTGGYSRIAIVTTVDLPLVAQTPPGKKLRFVSIDINEAQRLYRKRESTMEAIRKYILGRVKGFRIRMDGEELFVFMEEL